MTTKLAEKGRSQLPTAAIQNRPMQNLTTYRMICLREGMQQNSRPRELGQMHGQIFDAAQMSECAYMAEA
jgi:hypothetical protein